MQNTGLKKTVLAALTAIAAATLVACGSPASTPEQPVAEPGHYETINGVDMYYEVHGDANDQPPLVLLHGALSGIGTDFGELIPVLSKQRQVIAVEQQAHGHSSDIDRPLRTWSMADDTATLLERIGVRNADVFGYSMGAGVALDIGIRHPELVHKLVLLSGGLGPAGMHPGVLDGIGELQPEMLHGSTFHDYYLANAPRPQDFPTLVSRVKEMDGNTPTVPADAVRALPMPVLNIIGDSDIVTPEHAVEVFRLLGGGIMGDTPAGLIDSQLAIVPGASHVSVMHRPELLAPMVTSFLDRAVTGKS
ncbi:alpha/beta fold hydrolase [Nocardia huaxiensis]|uniref:Alpha/beta hydrolase n=1 Tax=Nocardia huaxiensis TaxID=2755382 RepID=A0A7D6ZCY3_9NOCA|nr:alpha/beta hydrolase [Nocardia huaxiensis]QLY32488.1 alpha/beta hydrolase [Nocardia huaxiensis]UFS93804.1 alpha/beta hydrolase [Nocardia huaxiensis]